MDIAEFQSIYWWEWGHRQFGRLMGLLYVVPMLALLVLWLRGKIAGSLPLKLLLIGFLGGLQAAIGWIMYVASGLEPGMTAVAPPGQADASSCRGQHHSWLPGRHCTRIVAA